jgi:hypothetical protein
MDHDDVAILCRTRLPGPAYQVLLAMFGLAARNTETLAAATGMVPGALDEALQYLLGRGIVEDTPGGLVVTPSPSWREPVASTYSEVFEAAWKIYPKRTGNNPKADAWKSWRARVKEGVSELELLTATRQYLRHIQSTGKENTPYVMVAQRFYGSSKPYDQEWATDDDGAGGWERREWDRSPVNNSVPRFTEPLLKG